MQELLGLTDDRLFVGGLGALCTGPALFPSLFLTIKLCGAAYIAWLGIQLLRSARTPLPSGSASPDEPEL